MGPVRPAMTVTPALPTVVSLTPPANQLTLGATTPLTVAISAARRPDGGDLDQHPQWPRDGPTLGDRSGWADDRFVYGDLRRVGHGHGPGDAWQFTGGSRHRCRATSGGTGGLPACESVPRRRGHWHP